MAAMGAAARAAIAYRQAVAEAERTPVADYARMLAAFAGPTPETGAEGTAIGEGAGSGGGAGGWGAAGTARGG